jgi:hypothetical protein
LDQLEQEIVSRGFTALMKNEENRSYPYGFTSSYYKTLSKERRDYIYVNVWYSAPGRPSPSISITVAHTVRGMDPPVKDQIDSLGEKLFDKLVETIGKSRVTIERRPIRTPWVL